LSFRNFAFSGRLTGGNRLFNVLTLTGTAAPNYGPWKLATKAELDRIGLVRRWATWAWVDPEQGAHVTALLEIGKTNHFAISQLVRVSGTCERR